jgi:hypothetical protein
MGAKYFKQKCPVHDCKITHDRNELESSDLVFVSAAGQMNKNDSLPPREVLARNRHIRTVFFRIESMLSSHDYSHLNGQFNLSSTFHTRSDFVSMYYGNALFRWAFNDQFTASVDYLSTKKHFAFILTSHCKTFSQRGVLVAEMQKYARVDIIGGCGNLTCGVRNETVFSKSRKCRSELGKDHMFALAFENSLCEDYVTEKFFDSVVNDAVPVVYGHAKYDRWLPKSAYIDVRDFARVKDLVDFMLHLSKNATAYNSYFKWKQFIVPLDRRYQVFCDMCIKLHLESIYGIEEKVFDMKSSWNVKKQCLVPKFSKDSDANYKFEPVSKVKEIEIK